MGSSASKAARKYPTRPPQAVFQNGVKVPSVQAEPEAPSRRAEGIRSEAIEADGADPHFLSKLSKLGQVQANHNMQPIRPAASNTGLFDSRAQLSDLLDHRKSVKTKKELENLAQEFAIDLEKLESLTRFVNSPSVDSSTIRPAAGKTEEEGFIATAVWVEPQFKG